MKNSEDYFKILEELGDGVICINDKNSIVYINNKAKDILGYDYLNITPKHILDIFDIKTKSNNQITMKIIEEIRSSGFARGLDYGAYLFDAFNDKRFISASLSLIILDDINHIVISFRDITLLKKLELENAEQKRNLESIFNSIPVGIIVVDFNRHVLQTNPFMKKNFELDDKDRAPNFLGNILKCSNASNNICGYGDNCKDCIIRENIDKLREKNQEDVTIKTKMSHAVDNHYKYSDYQISFVKILQKNQHRVLLLIQDITEQVEYESEIKIAKERAEESNRLKNEFLSNFSHEIRTPLNGIIGMIDLSKKAITDNETLDNLNMAKDSSLKLLDTINSVIDIAKIENMKFNVNEKPFDINSMLKEVYEKNISKIEGRNLRLILEKSPYNTKYIGDYSKIKKIINYLLDNAIKFTETGSIKILHKLKEVDCGEVLEVHIIDTGIGINPKSGKKIFESFTQIDGGFTRQKEGNGLGLTISKRIAEMLGGTLGYESELNKGSDFYFIIPLKKHSPKSYSMEKIC